MKRSLSFWGITGPIVVILFVGMVIYLIYWVTTPGDYQQRFNRINVGMSEQEVEDVLGSEGDVTAWIGEFPITGNNRQRVWHVKEKGDHVWIIVVFDGNSRVVNKGIEKHSVILNDYVFKDL
jgi:hypothetical protein